MRPKDGGKSFLRAVGRAIRSLRKAKGLSQEELALAIQIDRTYISGIERGARNPSLKMLHLIAVGLGLRPSEILKAAEAES
jgi:transcriptional regulator with XRE-family HTH domain